jgi:hypothetical protein
METEEHGGFVAKIDVLDLGGKSVRNPGTVIFLPTEWPFTEVVSSEVSDVSLEDSSGLKISKGKLIIEGEARYTVVSSFGEEETRIIPIIGRMHISQSLKPRLEEIQNPPSERGSGVSSDDRIQILKELYERVAQWGKPLVLEAIEKLQAGIPLDDETLKGLRHRMYKSQMNEVEMFRSASWVSPKQVAIQYASLRRRNP